MTLHVRAKMLCDVWSYDFMTWRYPLNNSDVIIMIKVNMQQQGAICHTKSNNNTTVMSQSMTNPTKWPARPGRLGSAWAFAQPNQSLCCPHEESLGTCMATHKAHSEDSDQTGRMPRLIWVFAGRTSHFVGFVELRLSLQAYRIHNLQSIGRQQNMRQLHVLYFTKTCHWSYRICIFINTPHTKNLQHRKSHRKRDFNVLSLTSENEISGIIYS